MAMAADFFFEEEEAGGSVYSVSLDNWHDMIVQKEKKKTTISTVEDLHIVHEAHGVIIVQDIS